MNLGETDAEMIVSGIDDSGSTPGMDVSFTVPAGKVVAVKASDLESGADTLEGALGDGTGKWQLTVRSNVPVKVMSILENPTGHLTNLSTIPY